MYGLMMMLAVFTCLGLNLQEVGYDSALSLIVDVRTVIPGSGTTAPVGWAALPLFQSGPGRYMASGYYHLPIFKVCSCSSVQQSALCPIAILCLLVLCLGMSSHAQLWCKPACL